MTWKMGSILQTIHYPWLLQTSGAVLELAVQLSAHDWVTKCNLQHPLWKITTFQHLAIGLHAVWGPLSKHDRATEQATAPLFYGEFVVKWKIPPTSWNKAYLVTKCESVCAAFQGIQLFKKVDLFRFSACMYVISSWWHHHDIITSVLII